MQEHKLLPSFIKISSGTPKLIHRQTDRPVIFLFSSEQGKCANNIEIEFTKKLIPDLNLKNASYSSIQDLVFPSVVS